MEDQMKKMKVVYQIVVLVLLAISVIMFSGIAQAGLVPDGLAGVPWGATRSEVKKIMIENGFQEKADPFSSEPYPGLVFYGSFANRMCYLYFEFKGKAFCSGTVMKYSYSSREIIAEFNYFVKLVTDKYGAPQKNECMKTNTGVCGSYDAEWTFVDSASSDVYTITFGAAAPEAALFKAGTPVYFFALKYTAESLKKRLKEDGI
jgi:hypothetical protein